MARMKRDLDARYFEVTRDGMKQQVCFTDLTKDEMEVVTADKANDPEFWKDIALHLKSCMNEMADRFGIARQYLTVDK